MAWRSVLRERGLDAFYVASQYDGGKLHLVHDNVSMCGRNIPPSRPRYRGVVWPRMAVTAVCQTCRRMWADAEARERPRLTATEMPEAYRKG